MGEKSKKRKNGEQKNRQSLSMISKKEYKLKQQKIF